MDWGYLSGKLYRDTKIIAAGPAATGIFVMAISWSIEHETDGVIPLRVLNTFGATLRSRNILVAESLLRIDGKVCTILNYLKYQKSKSHFDRLRADRSDSGQKGGIASAQAKAQARSQANSKQIYSKSKSKETEYVQDESGGVLANKVETQPPFGKAKNKEAERQVRAHLAVAMRIHSSLSAERKRLKPNARDLVPTYDSLHGIAGRLDSGRTEEECMAVIANCVVDCKKNPKSIQYFDTVSPWRPDNFERMLHFVPSEPMIAKKKPGPYDHFEIIS